MQLIADFRSIRIDNTRQTGGAMKDRVHVAAGNEGVVRQDLTRFLIMPRAAIQHLEVESSAAASCAQHLDRRLGNLRANSVARNGRNLVSCHVSILVG